MKIPVKPKLSDDKQAYLDKLEERESWYKLVVKVICWKDGAKQAEAGIQAAKITAKEWKEYSERVLKTNTTTGKQKTTENLEEIKKAIKQNGGFE